MAAVAPRPARYDGSAAKPANRAVPGCGHLLIPGGFPRGCREQVALSLQERSLPRLTSPGVRAGPCSRPPALGPGSALGPGPHVGSPCGPGPAVRPALRGATVPAPPRGLRRPPGVPRPPWRPRQRGLSRPGFHRTLGRACRHPPGVILAALPAERAGPEGAARVRCASGITARSARQAFSPNPRGPGDGVAAPRHPSPGSYRRRAGHLAPGPGAGLGRTQAGGGAAVRSQPSPAPFLPAASQSHRHCAFLYPPPVGSQPRGPPGSFAPSSPSPILEPGTCARDSATVAQTRRGRGERAGRRGREGRGGRRSSPGRSCGLGQTDRRRAKQKQLPVIGAAGEGAGFPAPDAAEAVALAATATARWGDPQLGAPAPSAHLSADPPNLPYHPTVPEGTPDPPTPSSPGRGKMPRHSASPTRSSLPCPICTPKMVLDGRYSKLGREEGWWRAADIPSPSPLTPSVLAKRAKASRCLLRSSS